MSDPLAENLYEAMGEHGASFIEGGRSICSCGADMGADSKNVWVEQEMHNLHLAEVLAKAARAFIGDEINAKYEAAKPILNRWDPKDDGYEYGLDIAEQIARGDTK